MRILITGKGSYIGTKIKSHLESFGHFVEEADTISDEWKQLDYSQFDTVVHVAAIVHDAAKCSSEDLFNKINTQLPESVANLAKQSGVKQFVFLSTMGVFGREKALDYDKSIISSDTPVRPVGLYGKSKYEAEKKIKAIEDENFKVAIIRPPNVYGPGCKGNYIAGFLKLSKMMFICPYAYTNIRQSMIHIDNLSEIIRLIIENKSSGLFHPQDNYVPNTVDIIEIVRSVRDKKTKKSKTLGKLIKLFSKNSIVNKIYGGINYDEKISDSFQNKYQIVEFKKGMEKTYKAFNE